MEISITLSFRTACLCCSPRNRDGPVPGQIVFALDAGPDQAAACSETLSLIFVSQPPTLLASFLPSSSSRVNNMVLVPYSNVMRIGQGFNSYTQACCIDKAVTFVPLERKKRPAQNDSASSTATGKVSGRDPERISQRVAYKCSFISNMSEIAKELNVSGALCIKKGSLDASGSGQYIDEEQVGFNCSFLSFFTCTQIDSP